MTFGMGQLPLPYMEEHLQTLVLRLGGIFIFVNLKYHCYQKNLGTRTKKLCKLSQALQYGLDLVRELCHH